MNDFVVFILSHGRADRVVTYDTLRRQGYTGRVVIVLDDEDTQREDYIAKFGKENVTIFSKAKIAEQMDEVIKGDRRTIVYARNACFDIATKLGYKYFLELDDDYIFFGYVFDANFNALVRVENTKNLDYIFERVLEFFIKNERITSIAFAQGGDFIGGRDAIKKVAMKRKCMNSFFCSTERPFKFIGRINEDVNTYTLEGSKGKLFLTLNQFALNQTQTQSNDGGMTDVYLDSGTYLKSFFSIIVMPSAVKVAPMNSRHSRLHHKVQWRYCVPKILNEKHKKH